MIMKKTYKFMIPQNKEVESTKVRVENGEMFVDVEFKERLDPKDGSYFAVTEITSKGDGTAEVTLLKLKL